MIIPTTAMVLAAGRGTRLGDITKTTPKPLVPVGGQPVIFHTLAGLHAAGVKRAVVNSHYLGDMLINAVQKAQQQGLFSNLEIIFSPEDELLETGGGIVNALPLLGGNPFFVMNSDAVFEPHAITPLLHNLAQGFASQRMDFLLTLVPTTITTAFRDHGDFACAADGTLAFAPPKSGTDEWVYAGAFITHPAAFADEFIRPFSLLDPWRAAQRKQRLHGLPHAGLWADMGTPVGLAYAQTLVKTDKSKQKIAS